MKLLKDQFRRQFPQPKGASQGRERQSGNNAGINRSIFLDLFVFK